MADGGQAGERAVEQLPGRAAADVGDEADAACVAFSGRVVEEPGGAAHLR